MDIKRAGASGADLGALEWAKGARKSDLHVIASFLIAKQDYGGMATRAQRVEVDAKFFWDFTATALVSMRDLAAEARKQGQRGQADALDARIDEAARELERIQKRAAR
jgi:hypothetical protein